MVQTTMTDILRSPDKQIKRTFGGNGVLSRLWRQILLDLGIGPERFGVILQEFVTNPINGIPNNKKDQISCRGNLTKELARPQMTWKVFMKALRFLNIISIEITLTAKHVNATTTIHKTVVNLGGRHGAYNFTKDLEQPEYMEEIQEIQYLDKRTTNEE